MATIVRVNVTTSELRPRKKGWSARVERYAPWFAALVLVVGVAAVIVKFAPSKNAAPQVLAKAPPAAPVQQTVKFSPGAAKVMFQFIRTAVAREDLATAWKLAGPNVRGGLTHKEWLTGAIPVVPYPIDVRHFAPRVKIDYSYKNDAQLELALLPKAGSGVRPQYFIAELKRLTGADGKMHWVVNNWVPRTALAVPRDPGSG